MIFSLNGIIKHIEDTFLVINVNDVGYILFCSSTHLSTLSIGESTELVVYHYIKEDNQQLFGFCSIFERDFFKILISVSGIGPKVALNILSSVNINDFINAIQNDNIMFITQCPGIGKKTAERLIIELKDKLPSFTNDVKIIDKKNDTPSISSNQADDVVLALKQLGYQKDEIKRAFLKHAKEISVETTTEAQIKILLNYL